MWNIAKSLPAAKITRKLGVKSVKEVWTIFFSFFFYFSTATQFQREDWIQRDGQGKLISGSISRLVRDRAVGGRKISLARNLAKREGTSIAMMEPVGIQRGKVDECTYATVIAVPNRF